MADRACLKCGDCRLPHGQLAVRGEVQSMSQTGDESGQVCFCAAMPHDETPGRHLLLDGAYPGDRGERGPNLFEAEETIDVGLDVGDLRFGIMLANHLF